MELDPKYFPPIKGLYEVSPGLRPIGYDFGNGQMDRRVFQITESFSEYRRAKIAARKESLAKYYPKHKDLNPTELLLIADFFVESLCSEYPTFFSRSKSSENALLTCKLTDEILAWDISTGELDLRNSSIKFPVPARNLIDALAMQVQEDFALWTVSEDPFANHLSFVHLCFPNHWDPSEKISNAFNDVHAPVASFEKMKPAVPNILKSLRDRGPFVRFAWGLATDTRLNHHPSAPEGVEPSDWNGRSFEPRKPLLFMRIERQTLHPFPQIGKFLFTIRTYFRDTKDLTIEERTLLATAVEKMSMEEREYKGLQKSAAAIIHYLRN